MHRVMQKNRTGLIILAAGKGTRMNGGEQPKVLVSFLGRPIIEHLLQRVSRLPLSVPPVLVVGHKAEEVKRVVGDSYWYALQSEQRGTGHATAAAESVLKDLVDQVCVIYGDHPLISADVLEKLMAVQSRSQAPVTLLTFTVPYFEGVYSPLYYYGRIIRDDAGNIIGSVELKDCTPEQKEVREVNVGIYCFDASWLWEHLPLLVANNSQHEYYLTDLIHIAIEKGFQVVSYSTDDVTPTLAMNTNADREFIEKYMRQRVVAR